MHQHITLKVLFSGRVQGVGFRWATQAVAREFAVTGFVRNLLNGQVELVVQGEEAEVNRMVNAVSDRMRGNIELTERHDLAESTEYSDFRIRR